MSDFIQNFNKKENPLDYLVEDCLMELFLYLNFMQIFTLITSHRKYMNRFKGNVQRLFKRKYYDFVLPTDLELDNGRFIELFNVFGKFMKSIEIKNNLSLHSSITKYRLFSTLRLKCPLLRTLRLTDFYSNNISFAHVFPLIKKMEIIEFINVAFPGFLMTFINKGNNLIELRLIKCKSMETSIDVNDNGEFTNRTHVLKEYIGKTQPNLRKILLIHNANIDIVTFIKHVNILAPNVQELTLLDNHINPSDRLFAHYNLFNTTRLKNLTVLRINFEYNSINSIVMSLKHNKIQLKELIIQKGLLINDDYRQISRITTLECLGFLETKMLYLSADTLYRRLPNLQKSLIQKSGQSRII